MAQGSLRFKRLQAIGWRRLAAIVSFAWLDRLSVSLDARLSALTPSSGLRLQYAGGTIHTPVWEVSSRPICNDNRDRGLSSRLAAQPSLMQRGDTRGPIRTGELFAGSFQNDEVNQRNLPDFEPLRDRMTAPEAHTEFEFEAPNAYPPSGAHLVSLLGDTTAPIVDRVTKLVRTNRTDSSPDLLDVVRREITGSAEISVFFHRVSMAISSALDIGCAIAMISADNTPTISTHHPIKEFASLTGPWFAETIRTGELSHSLKTRINPLGYDQVLIDDNDNTHPLLASSPVRSVQLFPLPSHDRWVGGLLLFDDTLLKLDTATIDTMKAAARAIGRAIDEKLRRPDSLHRMDQWRGWGRVLTALSVGEATPSVLRDLLAIGHGIVKVDGALISLHDADLSPTDRLVIHGDGAFEKLLRAVIQHGGIDELTSGDRTSTAPTDTAADASAHLARLRYAYPTRTAVPIQNGSTPVGEMFLFRSSTQSFDPAEMADIQQFAAVIAVTVQQSELVNRRVRQDQVLATVRGLADRLNRASSQQAMAEIAVEVCATVFGSGKASLHLYQEQSDRLVMAAAYGLPLPFVTANAHLSLGVGACGKSAQKRSLVVVEDVTADPDWMAAWHVGESGLNFRSVWSLPLMSGDNYLLGTMAVYHASVSHPSDEDVSYLQLIGHQIATALDRARLADRSQDLYRATVESLAAAVDAKDPFTHNHSWQVSAYCRKIAEALKLPSAEIEIIELAGLLHDVGKIGIPDRVLQKPDALAPDEWAMMRRHPDLGARILGDNPALAPVVPFVRHHHERYDGHGYPDQLSGNDIPLGAAIVGLADAFDTMTSDRPYRRARTMEQALQEVARSSGSHFHPKVASAFLQVVKSGGIQPLPSSAARGTTRELRLKRVVGSEARGFGLLQRITTEIGALVDLDRFLHRLNELMSSEFPDSICEIYGQDPNSGDLIAIANQRRRKALVIPRGQGIAGWVAAHGVSQNVPDVLEDARYIASGHRLMRSILAVPLVVDSHCAGVLSLEHPEPMAYSPSDQHVLEIVATYVAQAIQVANLHDRLKRNVNHDPLTGLPNHREFCQRLEEEIERARMTAGKLAIAILDVKSLKVVNRSHGHNVGDDVLKSVADVLRLKVRSGDTVARYGGDEFALLVPRVTGSVIRARVSTISDALDDLRRRHPVPAISWGVGSFPTDGTRAAEIIAAAETDMHANARRGIGPSGW